MDVYSIKVVENQSPREIVTVEDDKADKRRRENEAHRIANRMGGARVVLRNREHHPSEIET